jgi:hypothetical protein
MIINTVGTDNASDLFKKRSGAMISNELQKRIHFGDRDAFLAIYEEYGHGVYAAALKALCQDAPARSAVKQTFLTLYDEILTGMDDFDIPVRIRELSEREIALMRAVCGEECALPDEAMINPDYASARGAYSDEEKAFLKKPLPPLERERYFRRPIRTRHPRYRRNQKPKKSGAVIKTMIFLLDLLLIWALAGVLMALGYLPAIDLGYSWVSQNVFPILGQIFSGSVR